MCPESRAHLARGRDANIGDVVTAKEFRQGQNRFTMYARTSDPSCPICLPDGATVRFTTLPDAIRQRSEVAEGPIVATLANGAFYDSTFVFVNGAKAQLSEIKDVVFEVIPALATADEIDAEVERVFAEVGRTIEREIAVAAATSRMAVVGAQHGRQTVAAISAR